jgi:hypothetical protein
MIWECPSLRRRARGIADVAIMRRYLARTSRISRTDKALEPIATAWGEI